MQLNYVYSQILFLVTGNMITRNFKNHAQFDLRRLLQGSDMLIEGVVNVIERKI